VGTGPPLALPTKKIQAFLAYLALPPGREHSRDKLASLLWGDLPQGHARNSLRQALFALRQVLEPVRPACLRVEGASIALNVESVDVDAVSFERLVGEQTPEALERAVELYRGDLLEGLTVQEGPFEEWLMGERERLRELALEALAKLLVAQRGAGAVEAALQAGLRLIGLDPLHEPVHRTLMRLYAQLGRRGSALHQYQLCVGVLQRELGVDPEEETKRLYQEILRGRSVLTMTSEPAASGAAPFTSIRRPPRVLTRDTPLIGRDQEMARLRASLARAVNASCTLGRAARRSAQGIHPSQSREAAELRVNLQMKTALGALSTDKFAAIKAEDLVGGGLRSNARYGYVAPGRQRLA
jgi:DNA-binding SARP family transcriptional activator